MGLHVFEAVREQIALAARAPVSPGEVRRTERWLATARVFLTITALVAIWMDSASLGYPFWTFVLLGVYITLGLVIMVLLRVRQQSTRSFRLLVHAADVGWPALISLVGAGPNNPFFLFFVFVLAAGLTAGVCWKQWRRRLLALLCCGWIAC